MFGRQSSIKKQVLHDNREITAMAYKHSFSCTCMSTASGSAAHVHKALVATIKQYSYCLIVATKALCTCAVNSLEQSESCGSCMSTYIIVRKVQKRSVNSLIVLNIGM